jgi:hypothetical protein
VCCSAKASPSCKLVLFAGGYRYLGPLALFHLPSQGAMRHNASPWASISKKGPGLLGRCSHEPLRFWPACLLVCSPSSSFALQGPFAGHFHVLNSVPATIISVGPGRTRSAPQCQKTANCRHGTRHGSRRPGTGLPWTDGRDSCSKPRIPAPVAGPSVPGTTHPARVPAGPLPPSQRADRSGGLARKLVPDLDFRPFAISIYERIACVSPISSI